ncbi:MAG: class I SAM-dependent methyltransferase [Acidobacteriota bacterium]
MESRSHQSPAPTYEPGRWDIEFLATNQVVRAPEFGISPEAKRVRYPIRLLRYWFGYHLLREEWQRVGRPLDVVEVGVHLGQMLEFVKSAPVGVEYSAWTAVDAVMHRQRLERAGYTEFLEVNLEDRDLRFPRQYDTAILLHVLEHLFEPEAVFEKIVAAIKPGGSLIGGFPVVPGPLAGPREKRIRRTAQRFGHVSVFSPERVERMAARAGLKLEFMSGAFLMRSKGSPLENSEAWMRFNLAWGGVFPGWPGEIYWIMRK